MTRRDIINFFLILSSGLLRPFRSEAKSKLNIRSKEDLEIVDKGNGESSEKIFCSKEQSPEINMNEVLNMLGGIDHVIDSEDIVVIKVNAQWWSQGTTNTDLLQSFIEHVLARNNFIGEVIIVDNHQYDEPNSRGWTTERRNGKFNLNELVLFFQEEGFRNVTKYHWTPVTPLRRENVGKIGNSKITEGPWHGDGYVYDEKLFY